MPLNLVLRREIGPAPTAAPITIELDKIVPALGNLFVRGQQVWLGPDRAGTPITLRISTTHLRVLLAGVPIKTVASQLTASDLHTLAHTQQARILDHDEQTTHHIAAGVVEVERTVNAIGYVGLANKTVSIGHSLAGRRVTLRFDGDVLAVLDPTERTLLRSLPNPLTTRAAALLRGARPAGPPPTHVPAGPVTVERIVSSSGGIMIARQRIQIGRNHARAIVTATIDEDTITVHHGTHLLIRTPRTNTTTVTRHRASNH
ncbi:hypothetical protein [Nocardia amamiensis]|uniref:hypothetical protein n=1 Tax=Nocardia amamiensis TaxID=404578 RepID=UPI00340F9D3E